LLIYGFISVVSYLKLKSAFINFVVAIVALLRICMHGSTPVKDTVGGDGVPVVCYYKPYDVHPMQIDVLR
jgi:hypothetical protein